MESENIYGKTPLHQSAGDGNWKYLYLNKMHNLFDWNELDWNQGQLNVVEYLVGKGGNIEAKDSSGWTPLLHAAKTGN